MVSYSALILILVAVAVLTLLGVDSAVFGQETTQRYLSAFVIGAVVMGTMTYVVWRFRESHPKNRADITPAAGGAHH
jgi:heme/copper-type cytochrome/quinol oxidase subunit 2